jgi:hypothetical protein
VSIEQDSKRRELERLWRKSYCLTGSVLFVAALIFLNDGDRMFALSLMLMRKLHLTLSTAELLVTPLLLIPILAAVVLLVLAVQNQLKINRLGCIKCGASRPFWTWSIRPYCAVCKLQQHKPQ